jgi:hypothetical protein
MTYSLSLRPRALAELAAARERYALVGHSDAFLDELDSVFEAIQAMLLRFPIVYGTIHRALLRRYPFAVFFRIGSGATPSTLSYSPFPSAQRSSALAEALTRPLFDPSYDRSELDPRPRAAAAQPRRVEARARARPRPSPASSGRGRRADPGPSGPSPCHVKCGSSANVNHRDAQSVRFPDVAFSPAAPRVASAHAAVKGPRAPGALGRYARP